MLRGLLRLLGLAKDKPAPAPVTEAATEPAPSPLDDLVESMAAAVRTLNFRKEKARL